MKILGQLDVEELPLWDVMKSHILTFMNKDIWNFCQMNLMSADVDFITFACAFMIMCADVPIESINYAVCCLLYIVEFNYAFYMFSLIKTIIIVKTNLLYLKLIFIVCAYSDQ